MTPTLRLDRESHNSISLLTAWEELKERHIYEAESVRRSVRNALLSVRQERVRMTRREGTRQGTTYFARTNLLLARYNDSKFHYTIIAMLNSSYYNSLSSTSRYLDCIEYYPFFRLQIIHIKMASRPLVSVHSLENEVVAGKCVHLPAVFKAPIRPDIVSFVHDKMMKNTRQPRSVNKVAGR